jgi:hypothetical protein
LNSGAPALARTRPIKRLKRRLPPVVLTRTIVAILVLAALLAYAVDGAHNLIAWVIFAGTAGFMYFLVNPLFDLGYQVEFSDSTIRQRPRSYRWIVGREPWTEMSVTAIHSFKYLQPSQSIYRESRERPVELLSNEHGRTIRIQLEPIAFDPCDFDELICRLERPK